MATDVSGQFLVPFERLKPFFYCLTAEEKIDRLSRNVCSQS